MTAYAFRDKWIIREHNQGGSDHVVRERDRYWTGMAFDDDHGNAQLFDTKQEVDAYIALHFAQEACP